MKKNTVTTIQIEDMSDRGEGIGHAEGYTLFVKDTVIGDVVQVKVVKDKKTYGYAKLLEILKPSDIRVEPRCPAAGPCGGCQLQAMNYKEQLEYKRRKVEEHLRRIGGFEIRQMEMAPVLGMEDPWHYRNKSQIPVRRAKDGKIQMGFFAGRTHSIIETPHCYLGDPVSEEIQNVVREHLKTYNIDPYDENTGKGLLRHILIRKARATGEILVCLVINGSRIPHSDVLVRALQEIPGMASISLNLQREKNNVILGQEVVNLYGPGHITEAIGDIYYQISPLSFFQVNPKQTEVLYRKVLEFAGLTGTETVWDLYCGAGTISLFLAQQARQVYGVEITPAAIDNARANARQNGITNAEFFVGKAEEVFPQYAEKTYKHTGIHPKADVIVVDPPRKGCDSALLEAILSIAPDRIVYVSCDSATLARDLKILCGGGAYEIKAVQPVDMFPQTVHIETIVLLQRQNS